MSRPATLDRANRQRHAALKLERQALAAVQTLGGVRRAFRLKRAASRCHHMADITMARLAAAASLTACAA